MELHACPVRLFTPELEAWLSLFPLTHEVRPGVGWVRTALPASGGVGSQPAKTIEALEWIRRVWNVVLRERVASTPPAKQPKRGR